MGRQDEKASFLKYVTGIIDEKTIILDIILESIEFLKLIKKLEEKLK